MASFKRSARTRRTSAISFCLRPSPIHGVGVFTTHPIMRGAYLRLFSPTETAVLRRPLKAGGTFTRQYGVPTANGRYWTAPDFGRMSVGWYLNHSERPNAYRYRYRFYSYRAIRAHEEITINYREL